MFRKRKVSHRLGESTRREESKCVQTTQEDMEDDSFLFRYSSWNLRGERTKAMFVLAASRWTPSWTLVSGFLFLAPLRGVGKLDKCLRQSRDARVTLGWKGASSCDVGNLLMYS